MIPPALPPAPLPLTARRISIGEFEVAAGQDRLTIYGLGSCVAVLLHDREAGLSALGHILLPTPPRDDAPGIPGRFAATAIPAMVEALAARGGHARRLVAKLAGAAQMFQFERVPEEEAIGARNLRAVLDTLERFGIPVAGRDVGGAYGRTIVVEGATGRMEVRAIRVEERVL
jgi:chemotaxis protein CheD